MTGREAQPATAAPRPKCDPYVEQTLTKEQLALLTTIRGKYERGDFDGVFRELEPVGSLLFEQKEGYWVYRCNHLVQLFALSVFREAIPWANDANNDAAQSLGEQEFCHALHVAPDAVLDFVSKNPLSNEPTRRIFAKAKQECLLPGGWRSRQAPMGFHSIVPATGAGTGQGYGPPIPGPNDFDFERDHAKDRPALLDAVRRGYETGHFLGVLPKLQRAGMGNLIEKKNGYWTYRRDELVRIFALGLLQEAIRRAELSFKESEKSNTEKRFCNALKADPNAVLELMNRERPLHYERSQRIFDSAKRKCLFPGGYRSRDRAVFFRMGVEDLLPSEPAPAATPVPTHQVAPK